jgi:hypothetical protein
MTDSSDTTKPAVSEELRKGVVEYTKPPENLVPPHLRPSAPPPPNQAPAPPKAEPPPPKQDC